MTNLQVHFTKILLSLSDWLDWSYSGITDHHRRVAFASLNLGQAIGLDGADLSGLFKASIVHDIGAVTWEEEQTLRQFDYFIHERLGGKGYSFGKSGTDLALEHRIVAVADIFTAVREDRPYRSAMDWADIERVLTSQARSNGIDGDVVLQLLGEKEALDGLWAELSSKLAPMDCNAALV